MGHTDEPICIISCILLLSLRYRQVDEELLLKTRLTDVVKAIRQHPHRCRGRVCRAVSQFQCAPPLACERKTSQQRYSHEVPQLLLLW